MTNKIYDVFIFFNELDLLELRLEILDQYVDYFVITESPKTFSGNKKPLYYLENKDRFKKFNHKIIHNIFDGGNDDINQWDRERSQRNSSMKVLKNCDDNDIIFSSDLDEIPNIENIDILKNIDLNILYICKQDFYYYYFNTIFQETNKSPNFWDGTRISSWQLLKNNTIDVLRDITSYFYQKNSNKIIRLPNSGWHFSFLGGAEAVKYKIESYSHQEMNNPTVKNNIEYNIKNLQDPFFRTNVAIYCVDIDKKTHPQYLVDHKDDIYKKYIKETL